MANTNRATSRPIRKANIRNLQHVNLVNSENSIVHVSRETGLFHNDPTMRNLRASFGIQDRKRVTRSKRMLQISADALARQYVAFASSSNNTRARNTSAGTAHILSMFIDKLNVIQKHMISPQKTDMGTAV
jgi:hypothetical protein